MQYLKNVVSLRIDTCKCTGCSVCSNVCPRNVLEIIDGKAVIINRDSCIECGACVNNCLFEAISVKSGVGCAAAMINGLIKTGDPSKGSCGCSKEGCC